jgi:flagellin-like hook-associated protein FlgL
MSTINEMVKRIRTLVIQASNDTNAHDEANLAQSDRTRIQDEINQLMDEIDATRDRTQFNTRNLIDGSLSLNGPVTQGPPTSAPPEAPPTVTPPPELHDPTAANFFKDSFFESVMFHGLNGTDAFAAASAGAFNLTGNVFNLAFNTAFLDNHTQLGHAFDHDGLGFASTTGASKVGLATQFTKAFNALVNQEIDKLIGFDASKDYRDPLTPGISYDDAKMNARNTAITTWLSSVHQDIAVGDPTQGNGVQNLNDLFSHNRFGTGGTALDPRNLENLGPDAWVNADGELLATTTDQQQAIIDLQDQIMAAIKGIDLSSLVKAVELDAPPALTPAPAANLSHGGGWQFTSGAGAGAGGGGPIQQNPNAPNPSSGQLLEFIGNVGTHFALNPSLAHQATQAVNAAITNFVMSGMAQFTPQNPLLGDDGTAIATPAAWDNGPMTNIGAAGAAVSQVNTFTMDNFLSFVNELGTMFHAAGNTSGALHPGATTAQAAGSSFANLEEFLSATRATVGFAAVTSTALNLRTMTLGGAGVTSNDTAAMAANQVGTAPNAAAFAGMAVDASLDAVVTNYTATQTNAAGITRDVQITRSVVWTSAAAAITSATTWVITGEDGIGAVANEAGLSEAGYALKNALISAIDNALAPFLPGGAIANPPDAPDVDGPAADTGGRNLWFHIGANRDQGINLNIEDVGTRALSAIGFQGSIAIDEGFSFADLRTESVQEGMHVGNGVAQVSGEEINKFITAIDAALAHVTGQRSILGAMQNRLEFTIENLDIASENLSAANSRIRDADMAKEMMRLTQSNVLQQAATAMLAQANQGPQQVLQLLG